ncbi:uncharacterized protein F4822DRAFT_23208 [Hypoxylon trugodes]|uniref:uncharacterized protein n=1 Tax=Hypoxylon trugodes TaxID=326681 RepID=UPI00219FD867|nr:uncharacterized protein F4822DRAFT_23208 [Hypoxylon trugodes]KAI1393750.1 hypothetical protein F4822DRAFT_23208 [Hypoxylon trugodes]
MLSNSGSDMIEDTRQLNTARQNDATAERKARKKRLKLSCMECRKKKLSCDRNSPCQRCIRSGRPAQCTFETRIEQPSVLGPSIQQQEEIQNLQIEITALKDLISKNRLEFEKRDAIISSIGGPPSNRKPQETGRLPTSNLNAVNPITMNNGQPITAISSRERLGQEAAESIWPQITDPRERTPQGYYGRHALFQFFNVIPELFPFIRETADEWFKPLGVSIVKKESNGGACNTKPPHGDGMVLESLLPPKEDTDILVSFYLDNLEQIHRIVHIPTFKEEYANCWIPQRPRHPAMTALILAMISISACATTADATFIATRYRAVCTQWISTCEEWLKQQSPKHRKFIHYQISCLVYLAKRAAMIGKKRWWKETSSLIQDSIIYGLHCESTLSTAIPYIREMKRRIWAVLRELDLQNTFEYGLPSLLHNIESDIAPPTNINDDDFDETSKEIPAPKPPGEYTYTSYQVHSSRSWSLRLEISQRLFSPKFSKPLSYDEVLRYTHRIAREIEAIPSWDTENALTHAYLLFQLKTCILALHQPYLHKNDGRYWLSETACYHASRDILLLHSKLAELGIQSSTVLREDLLLASLNLVQITMLQPKASINIMSTDSQSTIDLLMQCVPFMEDIHLRCCHSELWCFITMYAVIMLLKIHLGKETRQTAKAACARRYLDLHYRQIERHKMCLPIHEDFPPSNSASHVDVSDALTPFQPTTPIATNFPVSGWLDCNYSEFDIDAFDFDNTWGIWEPPQI